MFSANHCKMNGVNEMFFPEFKAYLKSRYNVSLEDSIIPQIKKIVQTTLLAAKDQMQTLENSPYKSFNVFGYDFMIDEDLNPRLIEVNTNPCFESFWGVSDSTSKISIVSTTAIRQDFA